MRRSVSASIAAVLLLSVWLAPRAAAHPSSGIVVNAKGHVFFQGGQAVWTIDASGQLTKYWDKRSGHWMALDPEGSFARAEPKLVERITPAGDKPAVLVTDGGAPVTVGHDGNLYYALRLLPGGGVECGITRVAPDGHYSPFAPDLDKKLVELNGITGLTTGPDGSLYVACPGSVLKVKMDGTHTMLASPVVVKDCDVEDDHYNPYLRGIAVDSRGTVYAAANGCHRVIKITPEGAVQTILKADRPWSPTGVACYGDAVYILEFTNSMGAWNEGDGWRGRVRKLEPDGKVTLLATIPRDAPPSVKISPDGDRR
jgi:hypothetical protein